MKLILLGSNWHFSCLLIWSIGWCNRSTNWHYGKSYKQRIRVSYWCNSIYRGQDSGDEGEVQSTPEGLAPRPPFVGMKFNSMEAALSHYNRYAHRVGFSVRIESSRMSTKDGEKDKNLFVCNKTGKNAELPPTPAK
jgi:hypothetical protein